jgi:hypothetical protein
LEKIDTSNLYDIPKTSQFSPFTGQKHLESTSDIASSNWSQSMRSGIRETIIVEELTFKLLLLDLETKAISKSITLKSKSVSEFDLKIEVLCQNKCYIAILQKNLFRSNCLDNQMAYCRLIGTAYSKKMLVKAKVEGLTGKEFYTFMIDNKPQTIAFDDDLAKKYPYSKCTLIGSDCKLFCIAWDLLKYNDQNKARMD